MAIFTRLGLGGSSAAYPGFLPKSTAIVYNVSDAAVTSVDASYTRTVDPGQVRTIGTV